MKKWIFALTLVVVIVPCLAIAQSDEESQRLVAEEEEKAAQWIPKGQPKLIPKDVIIDDMRHRRRTLYTSEHILFHYGLPKLRQEYYPQVVEIAEAIKTAAQHPELSQIRTYYIDGHCCIIGSAEFNCKLSWARANAVIEELVRLGVPREKLEPRGYGFYYPAFSNETEESRMRNRRVESSSDWVELAAKENRLSCNLAGDSRFSTGYKPRQVEAPAVEQAPAPAATPEPAQTGPTGKATSGEKPLPRGFNVKTPFAPGETAKPAPADKSTPLPRGFKEVK